MKKKKFKKSNQNFESKKEVNLFEKYLKQISSEWDENSPEPLAGFDYEKELEHKNSAFEKFLSDNGVALKPEFITPSPKPRNYRTTTKRRVFCDRDGIGLGFSEAVKSGMVAKSSLEPEEHRFLYEFLQRTLSDKTFSSVARALNWLIIRGDYERRFLILNVYKMDSSLIRKVKQLSEILQKEKMLAGAMIYFDPGRSEYYLEAQRPTHGIQTKHLFGSKLLGLKVGHILMRYSPVGFSQVNESMVPDMLEIAEKMLTPDNESPLLDLYCGYGLFSHTLGKKCEKVTGVELSVDAVNSAREISKRLKTSSHMKFISERIDVRFVRDKLAEPKHRELILLDPPRNGCEPGVISELAKRNPKRVLHIFCGTDAIPKEIKLWQDNSYQPAMIQPIDMFAGTPNLETMVLLERR